MKALVYLLLSIITITAFSQKKQVKLGEISSEELTMTTYDKDPEADAVILFDKGESYFAETQNGYEIRFTRHKRIKIFNKSATEHTEISIPYYADGYGKTEKVTSIEAFTFTSTDGRTFRKELQPEYIFDEQISQRWRQKKFTFPNVQDGSVLEVKYIMETPFHFNLPDWTFQDKIPTIYSEYEVSMIPFYEYVYIVQGISRFDYHSSEESKTKRTFGTVGPYGSGTGFEFKDYVHTYVLTDVPAFKDETYITSINDYIIKMDFQLSRFHSPRGGHEDIITTWPALNEALIKHEKFGKYIKTSTKLSRVILEEELQINDKEHKAKAIIDYVRENFEWNGYHSKYASQSAKDFLKTKNGNSADINLFLIGMLDEAGINTEPVILSTRGHGKIPTDHPFDQFTNYVVAFLKDDQQFLADGTDTYLPFNRLPIKCLNEKGLVVNEEKEVQWIRLDNNIPSIEKKTLQIILDSVTNDLDVTLTIQTTEYESYNNRSSFDNDSSRIIDYYTKKVGQIGAVKTINHDRNHLPYTIFLTSHFETEKLGENIILKPFLNLPVAKNNLTQKQRTYPVDFIYPWDNQFETTLKFSEAYSVTELPKDYKMDNDLAKITLNYQLFDGQLKVSGNYQFKKAVYNSNEYARIKHYLDEVVEKFNNPIVLEKQ